MSRYKPYPKYKESGVEWLGKVPEHWEVRKLSAYGSFIAGSGFPHEYQGLTSGDYPFFKVSDTNIPGNEIYLIKSENYITKKIARTLNVTIAPKNGIMFPKVGAALLGNKRRILAQESVIDNNTMVYVVRNGVTKYWYYWLSILDFGKISNPGPVPSVNESQLRLFPSISPPLAEQTAIANFLDRETAKIDTLIGKQERLIELLQEKRQALISHAVTKGLDPNVKMKDSGVAWLGEVPEHWEVKKFKYLFKIKKRIAGKLGYDVLSITQKGIKVKDIESGEGQLSSDYSKYQIVRVGDFAMNHMDLLTGFVDLSKFDGVTSPDYRVFSLVQQNASSEYYLYILQMGYLNKLFYPFGQGSSHLGRWRLPTEAFNEFVAPFPPLDEQVRISEYIKESLEKFEALTQKAHQTITLLKERRTALISAAVTGKIQVNDEVREDTLGCDVSEELK